MAAHIINVGQGSASLFEFSCGLVLIDTGGQANATTDFKQRFADYLESVFVRRPDLNHTIDVVYITHPHPDHTLGIPELIESGHVHIGHVVTDATTTGRGQQNQRKLLTYANRNRIPAVQINTSLIKSKLGLTSRNIDPLRCNGSDPALKVLWGTYNEPHHWSQTDDKNENNQSVAVRITFGDSSFLVSGDMEEPALRALLDRYRLNPGILNTDVYIAGHHGSRNGTIAELVKAMTPEIAVISAGNPAAKEPGYAAYNYGHPNKVALDLLSDRTTGVSMSRPSVNVAVGIKGLNPKTHAPPLFEFEDIDHAIFSTGWDGDIDVLANVDGSKRVIIN